MIVQILFGLTIGICLLITASACLVKNISGKTDNTKDFFHFRRFNLEGIDVIFLFSITPNQFIFYGRSHIRVSHLVSS